MLVTYPVSLIFFLISSVHSNEPLKDWLLESSGKNKVLESKKKKILNNKSNPW